MGRAGVPYRRKICAFLVEPPFHVMANNDVEKRARLVTIPVGALAGSGRRCRGTKWWSLCFAAEAAHRGCTTGCGDGGFAGCLKRRSGLFRGCERPWFRASRNPRGDMFTFRTRVGNIAWS